MRTTAGVSSAPEAGHPAASDQQPAGDPFEGRWLRDVAGQLWRRKAIVLTTVALVTLAAFLVVSQITPRYSAKARILVGVPKTNVINVENIVRGLRADRATLESEILVLTSRTLATKVADELDLVNEPAFNPNLRPLRRSLPSMLNPLRWIPKDWRAILTGADPAEPPPPSPTPEQIERRTKDAVAARVKGAVSARIQGRSRVIVLTARSTDPKLAAAVANTLADLYLVEQLEAKFEAARRANDWLNDRVQELRGQVEASERAVEEYRRTHGLIQGKNATVAEQQISEINTQLILARTKTAEAEARLRQIRSLVTSERSVESAAEVLASPLILRLRERETDVTRRAAEMATELGPRHPKMINIRAELEDLRAKLKTEVEKIVRGLSNELEVARIREQTLERNLENLKAETAKANTAQGRLRVLEREAKANRSLFDTFLERWKETGRQDEILRADARILSHARVPRAPSSPKKQLIVSATLAFSVFLGMLLVFLIEYLDSGFRSSEQVERMAGVGTLALIPMVSRRQRKRSTPAGYALSRPASSFSESLRTLYTSVLLSDAGAEPKAILITSSLPEEGKTTAAVAMARVLARGGRKVLLVDADLRRSRIAEELDLPNEAGLVQLLRAPEMSFDDVVQHDTGSDLHVLTTGRGSVPSPSDVFGSTRMTALLSALRDAYDVIIIDSPPVLLVSDARILARMVDRTVYVIQWAKTRRETAVYGLQRIAESGAVLAGAALTMVNMRKNARYAYADSGHYGYGASWSYYKD